MPAGAYIPPHLRNRSAAPGSSNQTTVGASQAGASASSALTDKPRRGDSQRPHSSDRASNSRTPWSRATPASSSRQAETDTWPTYDPAPAPSTRPGSGARTPIGDLARPSSGPGRRRPVGVGVGSPTLYVFGDSFVGPMKLLSDECSIATTYKGASAKGLNNPNSAKQVSKLLLPALNDLLAPPPYRYTPSSGRWALLVFGNVDLQINYLWQLQNKPISQLSFPPAASNSRHSGVDTSKDEGEGSTDTVAESTASLAPRSTLARATETSLTGPALGPELFVQAVTKAYTGWLEREIVNGPIGERLRAAAEKRRQLAAGQAVGKVPPPGKVLIAAALPPLVEDDTLPRIPEKYVERLEEEHEKAQRLLEGDERDWREGPQARRGEAGTATAEELEVGLATVQLTDRPGTPISTESTGSTHSSTGSGSATGSDAKASSCDSSRSSIDPGALSGRSRSHSGPKQDQSRGGTTPHNNGKASMADLLAHDPPLCTLPIRVQMTNSYNSILSTFCAQHKDVLSFVDISPRMHAQDAASGWGASKHGEVDRGTWACPVDPTNVHPLWEPTLPLWLEALGEEGLPVQTYTMEEGADETFKAYELDKRRRTAKRGEEDAERLKLRDE